MIWSYGITTVPMRLGDTFPRTLASLKQAGFNQPVLFVDGCADPTLYKQFNLEMSIHTTRLRTFGNWLLALMELYIREPHANFYAIFQDDLIASRNLKSYIETVPYPGHGYLNLYTFPQNQQICPEGYLGWYPSNQRGRGALAIVMNRECLLGVLKSETIINKPQDPKRGYKSVDGALVTAMEAMPRFKEYVHNPSLVMHTGEVSSIRVLGGAQDVDHMARFRGVASIATSFRGEDYDVMELVK